MGSSQISGKSEGNKFYFENSRQIALTHLFWQIFFSVIESVAIMALFT